MQTVTCVRTQCKLNRVPLCAAVDNATERGTLYPLARMIAVEAINEEIFHAVKKDFASRVKRPFLRAVEKFRVICHPVLIDRRAKLRSGVDAD